jgi:hypothetical protein
VSSRLPKDLRIYRKTLKVVAERAAEARRKRPRTFVYLKPPNPKTAGQRPEGEETIRQLRTEFYLQICQMRIENVTLDRVRRAQHIQTLIADEFKPGSYEELEQLLARAVAQRLRGW